MVAATTSTACGLVALAPGRLWGLGLIAAATEGAALTGWQVRRRQARGWVGRHIRLTCGSYLSLATAALVVNWASLLAWVLPTVIGALLINRAVKHATHPSPRRHGPSASRRRRRGRLDKLTPVAPVVKGDRPKVGRGDGGQRGQHHNVDRPGGLGLRLGLKAAVTSGKETFP